MALKRVVALLCCVAAVAVVAGCGGGTKAASKPTAPKSKPSGFAGTPIPPGTTASDFALRDQNGKLVRLSQQRGRLVLLAFLYTQCKDVCPLIAAHLDTAVRSLGHQSSSVRVLAVSVDPANDTPKAVRAYVRSHALGPEFHWLVGSRARLKPVWQAYNVLVQVQSLERVSHAAPIFLIDRTGKPQIFYESNVTSAAVAHDLRKLIRSAA